MIISRHELYCRFRIILAREESIRIAYMIRFFSFKYASLLHPQKKKSASLLGVYLGPWLILTYFIFYYCRWRTEGGCILPTELVKNTYLVWSHSYLQQRLICWVRTSPLCSARAAIVRTSRSIETRCIFMLISSFGDS